MEEQRPVILSSSASDKSFDGLAWVTNHTQKQAFSRGFRVSLKICGMILLGCLPFAFLDPFAAMAWGSALLLLIILVLGPVLHLRFAMERSTFSRVDGTCPGCGAAGMLKPYVSAEFKDAFTVLCPACGQTSTARVP